MEAVQNGTTDSECRRLGGIPVGGWMALMGVVGMVVGAVFGAAGALWFVQRKGRQNQRHFANRKDGDVPQRALASPRGASVVSPRDDPSAYAPMGKYKQHLANSAEFSSYGTMKFVTGTGNASPKSLHTPCSAELQTPSQHHSLGSWRHHSHSDGRSSDIELMGQDFSGGNRSNGNGRSEEGHRQGMEVWPRWQTPRVASSPHEDGEKHRHRPNGRGTAERTEASSGRLDAPAVVADAPASRRSAAGPVKLERQYELEELEPQWHGILSTVDNKLAEQGLPRQRADERPIVMQSLLKSSPQGGAEAAINDAISCLLHHRVEVVQLSQVTSTDRDRREGDGRAAG